MNLTEIYNYAVEQNLGVEEKTIFIQNLPAQSGTPALMLKNSLEGTRIDYELPNYRKGRFQAIVRCKANRYEDGEALADLVGKTLRLEQVQLGNIFYHYIRPISEPIGYQLSDGANYEFSVNFAAVYVIVG